MKVLIVDNVNEIAEKILHEAGIEPVVMKTPSPEKLMEIIPEYDAIILRNMTKVTADVIEAAKNLKIIARAGVGVDNIDVTYAYKKGIVVVNSPDGNTEATAEHTIAMLLALSRNIPQAYESMHEGKFERAQFVGCELLGKTLGVIGYGKIGSRVAEIAKAFKMDVIVFDPFADKNKVLSGGAKYIENLEDLLANSDYITVHVPKNKQTTDLINKDNIYKIKKGAKIINCARGGIINEAALKESLQQKHLTGAALDVIVDEPDVISSPLYHCSDNIIMVPHLGASTKEAQIKVAEDVARQTVDVLSGKPAKTPVITH